MMIFATLLEKNPVGFWFLVGFICYPAIMIILFAIAEKIQNFFKKAIDKAREKCYNNAIR